MDVKTVCLGMLTDGEASGYDLKKEFESSFGHFFAAGYGSIYPALNALAHDGLVDCRLIPQEGKPDRKVYRITEPGGKQELLKALEKPNPSHKVRSEFLATMCFAHLMSREQVETVLDNRVKEAEQNLELFRRVRIVMHARMAAGTQIRAGIRTGHDERYLQVHRGEPRHAFR